VAKWKFIGGRLLLIGPRSILEKRANLASRDKPIEDQGLLIPLIVNAESGYPI